MSPKDLFSPLAIEVEMRSESASALKRVAHTLEKTLSELTAVSLSLDAASGGGRPVDARALARFSELRAEAEKLRWYLIVQREAMGLFTHDDIFDLYPLPPPRRS